VFLGYAWFTEHTFRAAYFVIAYQPNVQSSEAQGWGSCRLSRSITYQKAVIRVTGMVPRDLLTKMYLSDMPSLSTSKLILQEQSKVFESLHIGMLEVAGCS
jgi:hypothetical protein